MEVMESSVPYPTGAGYKRTEIGIIPTDWEIKPLHLLAEKITVGIANAATHAYRDRGVVMFRNQNIKPNHLDDRDVLYIDELFEQRYRNKRLKAGDLLTARTGYPGTTSIVPAGYDGAQTFTTLITRPRKSIVDPEYLCFFINSDAGQKYIEQSQAGGGQKNVNAGSLKFLNVALPPTKAEQAAIAEALSDSHALIASLEQLLAKKRQIKRGAMQDLLTGKKRLPSFGAAEWTRTELGELPSDWRVVPIGLIAEVKTGPFGSSLHERDYVDHGTPIITVEHLGESSITHVKLPLVSEADRRRLNAYSLEQGDIVFSRVGSVDRNARVTGAESGWLFSGRLLRLRASSRVVDTRFLSYQFHSEPFKQRVRTVAVGQTMASLNTQILKGVLVTLPPVPEQSAVAAILSDMDVEISALDARLAKARQIKQGMMQELLTGRIRLV
jgi:type I restriction enzyme S subunit